MDNVTTQPTAEPIPVNTAPVHVDPKKLVCHHCGGTRIHRWTTKEGVERQGVCYKCIPGYNETPKGFQDGRDLFRNREFESGGPKRLSVRWRMMVTRVNDPANRHGQVGFGQTSMVYVKDGENYKAIHVSEVKPDDIIVLPTGVQNPETGERGLVEARVVENLNMANEVA